MATNKTAHIVNDLEKHFAERLSQVLNDYGERLSEIGESDKRIGAKITSSLVLVAAHAVAATGAPPEEAGATFAAVVADWRAGGHPTHLEKTVRKIVRERKKS